MLFINPAQERFGGFLSRYIPVGIPVAIGSLAAVMKQAGIPVRVADDEIAEIDPARLRQLVQGLEQPYVFGLSCLTAHVVRAYALARMIKAEFPDSIVVAGGLHATALPEEALDTGSIDFVVRGEGEDTILKLYRAIREGGDPEKIPGLCFKRAGVLVDTGEVPLIPDLDTIPIFPYELFSDPKYDMGFIITSRGCPYNCTYCSQRMMTGTTYRFKSAQRIVEELEILVDRFKQKQIVFYDDNFCFKKRRVVEVCQAIIEARLPERCSLSIQTRADNFHADVVPIMAEAGFRHVGFGMETGTDRLADVIDKGETVQQHMDAVELAKRHGMNVSLFMIFGLPTETARDRETTFRLVRSAQVESSKYNNLIPYPGTPLYRDLSASPRVKVKPGWSNFNSTLSVTRSVFDTAPLPYVPETASEWELKRDIIRYNIKSYLNLDAVSAIVTGRKGSGWYKLPERWFVKPREIAHMARMAALVLVNLGMTSLPLGVSEPIMTALNPELRQRQRVSGFRPEDFKPSGWSLEEARGKAQALKAAQERSRWKPEEVPSVPLRSLLRIVADIKPAASLDTTAQKTTGA